MDTVDNELSHWDRLEALSDALEDRLALLLPEWSLLAFPKFPRKNTSGRAKVGLIVQIANWAEADCGSDTPWVRHRQAATIAAEVCIDFAAEHGLAVETRRHLAWRRTWQTVARFTIP